MKKATSTPNLGIDFLLGARQRQQNYQQALLRGCHPSSFDRRRHADIFEYVAQSEDRLNLVKCGQGMKTIIENNISEKDRLLTLDPYAALAEEMEAKASKGVVNFGRNLRTFLKRRPRGTDDRSAKAQKMARKLSQFRGKTTPHPNVRKASNVVSLPTLSVKAAKIKEETKKVKDDGQGLEAQFSTVRDAKIFYGSMVVLESISGEEYLGVDPMSGKMKLVKLAELEARPVEPVCFTLTDMHDPFHVGPINFGDPVWLVASFGDGSSWDEGSVVGSHIWEAPDLHGVGDCNRSSSLAKAEKLQKKEEGRRRSQVLSTIGQKYSSVAIDARNMGGSVEEGGSSRHSDLAHRVDKIGEPTLVGAFVPDQSTTMALPGPSTTENVMGMYYPRDPGYDALLAARNRVPMLVGKWKIGRAFKREKVPLHELVTGKAKKVQLTNTMEIFLEQDWFYIVKVPGTSEMALRQLPKVEPEHGVYSVEKRGIWKVHLLQQEPQEASGPALSQFQTMERLLFKATRQLRTSSNLRDGKLMMHPGGIPCGSNFSKILRGQLQAKERFFNKEFLKMEADKSDSLSSYFSWRMLTGKQAFNPTMYSKIGKAAKSVVADDDDDDLDALGDEVTIGTKRRPWDGFLPWKLHPRSLAIMEQQEAERRRQSSLGGPRRLSAEEISWKKATESGESASAGRCAHCAAAATSLDLTATMRFFLTAIDDEVTAGFAGSMLEEEEEDQGNLPSRGRAGKRRRMSAESTSKRSVAGSSIPRFGVVVPPLPDRTFMPNSSLVSGDSVFLPSVEPALFPGSDRAGSAESACMGDSQAGFQFSGAGVRTPLGGRRSPASRGFAESQRRTEELLEKLKREDEALLGKKKSGGRRTKRRSPESTLRQVFPPEQPERVEPGPPTLEEEEADVQAALVGWGDRGLLRACR